MRRAVRTLSAKPAALPSLAPEAPPVVAVQLDALRALLDRSRRLLTITGAGISTHSGIPDYRSPLGSYARGHKPITHQEFTRSETTRQRYWARSFFGFRFFSRARPNAAHCALAALQSSGAAAGGLITQNVDGLHSAAGSVDVLDLHGRIDAVECLGCGECTRREVLQEQLAAANADWLARHAGALGDATGGQRALLGQKDRSASGGDDDDGDFQRADGDWELSEAQVAGFDVPACATCGGVLKPAVTFFGGSVPPSITAESRRLVAAADALLLVGTSMQVFSAYRMARQASELGIPIAIVNVGPTRADELAALRIGADAVDVLPSLVEAVTLTHPI